MTPDDEKPPDTSFEILPTALTVMLGAVVGLSVFIKTQLAEPCTILGISFWHFIKTHSSKHY